MHTIIKYIFALIWLAVGPNLVWQMWRGGLDLLHPLNATFIGLAVVGTVAALFGPILRLISALSGVILACLSFYFYWPIWFSNIDERTTISTNFMGMEFINRSAQIMSAAQMVILILFSFVAGYSAVDTLEKKKIEDLQK